MYRLLFLLLVFFISFTSIFFWLFRFSCYTRLQLISDDYVHSNASISTARELSTSFSCAMNTLSLSNFRFTFIKNTPLKWKKFHSRLFFFRNSFVRLGGRSARSGFLARRSTWLLCWLRKRSQSFVRLSRIILLFFFISNENFSLVSIGHLDLCSIDIWNEWKQRCAHRARMCKWLEIVMMR